MLAGGRRRCHSARPAVGFVATHKHVFRTSAAGAGAGAGAASGTVVFAATLRCCLASFLLLFLTAAGLATFLLSGFLAGLFFGAIAKVEPASCLWRFVRVGGEHCQRGVKHAKEE